MVSRSPSGHASRSSMSRRASHGSPSLALSPMKMVKGQCVSPHWSGLERGGVTRQPSRLGTIDSRRAREGLEWITPLIFHTTLDRVRYMISPDACRADLTETKRCGRGTD